MDCILEKPNNIVKDGTIIQIHKLRGNQPLLKNRGIWTEDDDYNLLSAALIEGTKWSNISKRMKDRTEN